MNKLIPCKLCGCDAIVREQIDEYTVSWHVVCSGCKRHISSDSVLSWNTPEIISERRNVISEWNEMNKE